MDGFKEFLFSVNLVQLSVAIVLGGAFANLVTAFASGLITPLFGIFGAVPSFKNLNFTINGSVFPYGHVIDACITFLIMALIIYYAVFVPSTWIKDKLKKVEEFDQTTCPHCCSKVSNKATKCAFCTSSLIPKPRIQIVRETENMRDVLLQ